MAVPMSDEQRKAAAALLREQIPAAAEFGRLFARHGYQLALVGGLVRDVFLGKLDPAGDRDLATDATPEEVLAIAGGWADKVWTVGIAFGTVGLRKGNSIFEVTTYRSERYDRTSRRPVVTYGRSLEEDLSRRDFTINAMAAKLPDYEQVDPLEILPVERITGELTKLMLTPDPARGIDLMVQTNVADRVLPEVSRLRMEADEHHRHKDVYQHSLTVLRQAIELEPEYGLDGDLVVRLAALLHDIGKPKTRSLLPDGRVAFHLHEVVGAKLARRRLTALRFPNDVIR